MSGQGAARKPDLQRGPAVCAHTDFECDCDCACGVGVGERDCLWPDCLCGCDADCAGCKLARAEKRYGAMP